MPEGWDPLSVDFFNPPTADVRFEPHQQEAPRVVPGIEQLFAVQKNLITAVNSIHSLERKFPHDRDTAELKANLDSAYRQINSYLRHFGQKGLQTF